MAFHELDFCCVPLRPPSYGYFTSSPALLRNQAWCKQLVGRPDFGDEVGEWDPELRFQEIIDAVAYAAHQSLPSVLLPAVRRLPSPRYARALCHITNVMKINVWLMNPVTEWATWNWVRTLCAHSPLLGVVPVLPANVTTPQGARNVIDSEEITPERIEIRRWLTEPVRAVYFQGSASPSYHQLYPFVQQRCRFILQDTTQLRDVRAVEKVVSQERERQLEELPILATLEGFRDVIQNPLQPLQDNLESQAYEVFEMDTVKYAEYENALTLAMEQFKGTTEVVIVMVLGAGRGPFVRASLSAAQRVGIGVKVYAIEKNKHAVLTLRAMAAREGWGPTVEIVPNDVRTWQPPILANIMVSELLGSFACNELSPECVQGAMRLMCPPPRGVCIPYQYSNTLCPVQSENVYASVAALHDASKFDSPYVVYLHSALYLAAPQECFVFHHNGPQDLPDFDRDKTIAFPILYDGLVHGFAGEFNCSLFGPHRLTTVRGQETTNLCSWFSYFFPLKRAILVKQGQTLTVSMARFNNSCKVWYEWAVLGPDPSEMHNLGGVHSSIGLVLTH